MGLHALLKSYTPNSGDCSAKNVKRPAIAATPSTEPKAKAKAKTQPATKKRAQQPKADGGQQVKRQRIDIGSTAKRPSIDIAVPGALDEASTEMDSLSQADRALIDGYMTQMKPLKIISPPLADAAYKAALTEQLSSTNSIIADLKKKQRSAMRRAQKTCDPLYIELEKIATTMSTMQHLLKCCYDIAYVTYQYQSS